MTTTIHNIQCKIQYHKKRTRSESGSVSGITVQTSLPDLPSLQEEKPYPKSVFTRQHSQWQKNIYGRIRNYKSSHANIPIDHKDDIYLGTKLLGYLIPKEIREKFSMMCSQPASQVVIRVATLDPWIANIPWEVCASADWNKLEIAPPKLPIAIVRAPNSLRNNYNCTNSLPVKILVIGSAPYNSSIVNFPKSCEAIKRGITNAHDPECSTQGAELVEIRTIPDANLTELEKGIVENKPNVLHFVSHGGRGLLELEDSHGDKDFITANALAEYMSKTQAPLCLIVSISCLSMQNNPDANIVSIAIPCIDYAPYVIGMQLAISANASCTFVQALYEALASLHSVIDSYVRAREKLRRDRPQSPEWIAPVLYQGSSQPDLRLFRPHPSLSDIIQDFIEKMNNICNALNEKPDDKYVIEHANEIISEINKKLRNEKGLISSLPIDKKSQIKTIEHTIRDLRAKRMNLEQLFALDPEARLRSDYGDRIMNFMEGFELLRDQLEKLCNHSY